MIAYTLRKEGETNDKVILRYKKLFFQTRTTQKLRAEKHAVRQPSKRKLREKAIIREVYRSLNNQSV